MTFVVTDNVSSQRQERVSVRIRSQVATTVFKSKMVLPNYDRVFN
jgi:hypothetical protein